METRILRQILEFYEERFPDSEVIIDIGRKDIYYLKELNFVDEAITTDFSIGNFYIPPGDLFPNGKNFIYIEIENILGR